ncbi:hypothetical protein C8J57DRAFT_1253845 [Mycena rebaudengoi]|nr:hypothetical protein C8J57DRAFT_1253845 [Mycena rebaudengoi]
MAASAVHMGHGTAFSTFSSYVHHPLPNAPPTRRKRDIMPPNPDAWSPADKEYLDSVSGRQLMEYRNFHQSASAGAERPRAQERRLVALNSYSSTFRIQRVRVQHAIPLPSDPALDELMSLWEGSGTFPQLDFDASAFDHLPLLPPPPPESPPPKVLAVEQPEPGPSAPKSRRGPRQEVDVSFILPTDSKRIRGPSELKRRMDGDEISDQVQKRANMPWYLHEYGTLMCVRRNVPDFQSTYVMSLVIPAFWDIRKAPLFGSNLLDANASISRPAIEWKGLSYWWHRGESQGIV